MCTKREDRLFRFRRYICGIAKINYKQQIENTKGVTIGVKFNLLLLVTARTAKS